MWFATADPIRDKRLLPVEDLARSSVEAIRREWPEGPYILGGHCYGGVVAFEAALQLMSQGEEVKCLVLFDAATPGYPKVHKQWRRYVTKARELALTLRPGKIATTARAMRQHAYALGRIFARRRKGSASRVLTAIGSDVLVTGQRRENFEWNGDVGIHASGISRADHSFHCGRPAGEHGGSKRSAPGLGRFSARRAWRCVT